MNRDALLELKNTFQDALGQYDRENALAPDRHPIYCDCGACELVRAARVLVLLVDSLESCEPPPSPPCPQCKKVSRSSTAGCDHCDYEDK